MKQVIVSVPESKYAFFQELIQALGYEAQSQEIPITPAMDAGIERELELISNDPSYLLNWEEARKTLRRSNGSA